MEAEVVITGVGLVTPLGATALETRDAWRGGECAERRAPSDLVGTPVADARVAVLPDLDVRGRLGNPRVLRFVSEAAVLGCLAAHEAAQAAGLGERFDPERVGLFAGTGLAAARVRDVGRMIEASVDEAGDFSCRLFGERGLPMTDPLLSFKILANMPPCVVSIIENVRGPNLIFNPWEDQAGAAIIEAWRAVASGEVDCALAGGCDDASHAPTIVHLRQSGLLSADEFSAPGAGYLVMERAEMARRDGRPALAAIRSAELTPAQNPAGDPLAERIGRTFAAAPAVLLGLACLGAVAPAVAIGGAGGHDFCATVEVLA